MKKTNIIAIRIYGLLLNLYPRSYLREYKKLMEQAFRDMLKEDRQLGVCLRVARELPGNLLHEHMENINGKPMKRKDKSRLIASVLISIVCGVLGFFLSFLIGEGLMEVIGNIMAMLLMFLCVSIYNFIICLFLGRLSPNSIWFAGFLINVIVWVVLIGNLRGPGGFVDLWYGWTALILFAFIGSFIGSILLRKTLTKC
jgi:hypothetical protein